MPVFRVDKSRDYTVLSNSIFKDKTLSAKAKGILTEMLSLPEDWDYTLKGLSQLFSDGIDSVRQGVRELEEHGYVVRERKRDSKGRYGEMEYVIYETPHRQNDDEISTELSTAACGKVKSKDETKTPVSALPVDGTPVWKNTIQELPTEERSTQLNTNILSTKESNTNESNPILSYPPAPLEDRTGQEAMRERKEYRELIEDNISYGILLDDSRTDTGKLNELVELMVDTVTSKRSMIRIAGDDIPKEAVKSRFLKLNGMHIQYVLERMRMNTTEVRNIKQYLLTALYNAPATMESFYASLVNHDLYSPNERRQL